MLQDPHRSPATRPQDLPLLLRQATIFNRLADEQIRALARRTHVVSLGAGEILFQHGDNVRALYLLVQGQLKLYRASADGNEVIIDLVGPGMTFAECRVLLDDSLFHVSCSALADSEVAAIDLPAVLALLHGSVETCLLLLRRISERAERHVEDIDHLALQSSTCRVAGYLLGQLPAGRDEYVLKIAKSVMASRLAIRPETLSRILKQLRDNGAVSIYGNLVRVHSREKLQRLSVEPGRFPPGGGRQRRIGRAR